MWIVFFSLFSLLFAAAAAAAAAVVAVVAVVVVESNGPPRCVPFPCKEREFLVSCARS